MVVVIHGVVRADNGSTTHRRTVDRNLDVATSSTQRNILRQFRRLSSRLRIACARLEPPTVNIWVHKKNRARINFKNSFCVGVYLKN